MTKRVTIVLEESVVEELGSVAMELGKRKTQIIKEALQDYFDNNSVMQTVHEYKAGTLKTISHHDVRSALGL